jgi:hypothetical protein
MGRLDDYLSGTGGLRPADLSGKKTDQENYNTLEIKDILTQFTSRRSEYVQKLKNLDAELFSRSAFHPRLKQQMRLCDMLYFQAEHDQYHLEKIESLIKKSGNK